MSLHNIEIVDVVRAFKKKNETVIHYILACVML